MTNEIHENDMEPSEVRIQISDPEQDYNEKMKTKKAILDLERKTQLIFLLCCVVAFSLDPLFFYIPIINNQKKCLKMDEKLKKTMLVLSSIMNLTYIFHSAFQIFFGYLAYNSKSRRLLPRNDKFINRTMGVIRRIRWLIIIIDILCVIPIPQMIIFVYFPKMRGSELLNTINFLVFFVLVQFVLRIFRIIMACGEVFKNLYSSYIDRDVQIKSLFYFFLYIITIIASHVVGALWYFFSVQRELTCWQYACKGNSMCNQSNFFCDNRYDIIDDPIIDYLNLSCPLNQPSHFDFGMFTPALQSGIVNSMDFPKKFFYCYAWGLRNLSSFGSNLQTSTYFGESLFSAAITIIGLLLFIYLIGNLQTYLQFSEKDSEKKRREKMKTKQVEIDDWIKNNKILSYMREEIVDGFRRKKQENEDVNLKNILNVLPTQSKKHIRQRLCLPILKKVEQLQGVDDKKIDEILNYLKPVIFDEHTLIFKEGDPQMLFFSRGSTLAYSTARPTPVELERGDFYGEDLMEWVLTDSSSPFPISHKTVKTHKS